MVRLSDAPASIEFGNFSIFPHRRQLFAEGRPITLGGRAFDVLLALIEASGAVVSKDELLNQVWQGRIVEESRLAGEIVALRKAFGADRDLIRTVAGRGYQFTGEILARPVGASEPEAPSASAAVTSSMTPVGPASSHPEKLSIAVLPSADMSGDLKQEDMGEQQLDNIARTEGVLPVGPNPAGEAAKDIIQLALALPDKPSIAVLPCTNMSGDLEQEFFADGITEDIITALSHYPSLFVVARNSCFTYKGRAVDVKQVGCELGVRYVLEGSLRQANNRIRVTAQLVEAETGKHVWAEHYDRDLAEIFALQDEITEAVTTAIAPALAEAEQQRAIRKPPGNLDAWAAYQRGLWHVGKAAAEDNAVAQMFFRRAINLDPNFSGAYVGLAEAQSQATDFHTDDLAETLRSVEVLARRAVALDGADAEARSLLAHTLWRRADYEGALSEVRRALAISPNLAYAHGTLGAALIFSGQPREGLAALEKSIRLDPRDPRSAIRLNQRALGLYFSREYPAAVEAAKHAIRSYPDFPNPYRWLAAALGQLGWIEEGKDALQKAMAVAPAAFQSSVHARVPWMRPQDHAHMLEGLRKACGADHDLIQTLAGRGYQFTGEVLAHSEGASGQEVSGAATTVASAMTPVSSGSSRTDKPSAAVRPFQNVSGDPEQDYLGERDTGPHLSAERRAPRALPIGPSPGSGQGNMSRTRRLAAILAADVSGYSRLMEADEEGTLERLSALRRELVDPKIAEHRGRIVKTSGDGLLIEFASVVDALRCAIETQAALADRNVPLPPDRRIEFRIGIHQGDIVVENGDIFGDGVNVAARLEGLAEPGGICVTARVQEDASGRLGLAFEDMGEQALKNITRPVRAYRLVAGGSTSVRSGSGLAVSDKPSIAVFPFENMSDDPGQEYFADGMVEEIITALSRIRWLFVVARNSSFVYKGQSPDVKRVGRELGVRYVLEGSVRKAGGRVRITAQLIDAVNGAHLWADHFDGSLNDVFDLQDKVALSVAGVIEPTLQAAETARSADRPTNDLTAYDLYLRAYAMALSSSARYAEALRLLESAINRDPNYGPALAWAAFCCHRLLLDGRSEDPAADRLKGTAFARRAVEVAGDDPAILANAAYTLGYLGEDIGAMMALVDRALALNPSFARGWFVSGVLRLYAGQPDIAIEHAEASLRLSPRARVGWALLTMGAGHFYARRFDEAVPKLLLAIQEDPSLPNPYRYLAACYAHMGRLDEAQAIVRRLRAITGVVIPDLTYLRNAEHRAFYLAGLRLAAGARPTSR
jgi:TolB-like protein/class 3 adenylate cyclase/Tfp pilus assembly protein PilF